MKDALIAAHRIIIIWYPIEIYPWKSIVHRIKFASECRFTSDFDSFTQTILPWLSTFSTDNNCYLGHFWDALKKLSCPDFGHFGHTRIVVSETFFWMLWSILGCFEKAILPWFWPFWTHKNCPFWNILGCFEKAILPWFWAFWTHKNCYYSTILEYFQKGILPWFWPFWTHKNYQAFLSVQNAQNQDRIAFHSITKRFKKNNSCVAKMVKIRAGQLFQSIPKCFKTFRKKSRKYNSCVSKMAKIRAG